MQKDLNEKRSCKYSELNLVMWPTSLVRFLGLLYHKMLQAISKSIAFDCAVEEENAIKL